MYPYDIHNIELKLVSFSLPVPVLVENLAVEDFVYFRAVLEELGPSICPGAGGQTNRNNLARSSQESF